MHIAPEVVFQLDRDGVLGLVASSRFFYNIFLPYRYHHCHLKNTFLAVEFFKLILLEKHMHLRLAEQTLTLQLNVADLHKLDDNDSDSDRECGSPNVCSNSRVYKRSIPGHSKLRESVEEFWALAPLVMPKMSRLTCLNLSFQDSKQDTLIWWSQRLGPLLSQSLWKVHLMSTRDFWPIVRNNTDFRMNNLLT
jgi:hypothetical protein